VLLPEWNFIDLRKLLEELLEKNLIGENYKKILSDNLELVCEIVENNPRELKRFITSYIVASEIHHSFNEKIIPQELLLLQALNIRWGNFYQILVGCTDEVRKKIFEYSEMEKEQRLLSLKTSAELSTDNRSIEEHLGEKPDPDFLQAKLLLQHFRLEDELWVFLRKYKDEFSKIQEWEIYRRAAGSEKEVYRRGYESARKLPIPTDEAGLLISLDYMRESALSLRDHLLRIAKSRGNDKAFSRQAEVSLERLDATLDNLERIPVNLMFMELDHVRELRDDLRTLWRTAHPDVDMNDVGELAFRQFVARINHLITGLMIHSYQPHN
jgi:hypothetical protein